MAAQKCSNTHNITAKIIQEIITFHRSLTLSFAKEKIRKMCDSLDNVITG